MFGSRTYAHDIEVANDDGITIYYNWRSNENNEMELVVTYQGLLYGMYKYKGDVNIPEYVDYNGKKYSVTAIGYHAFDSGELTSISIPNSVKKIEELAFYQCSLSSLSIPKSVGSIYYNSFFSCYNLASIEVDTDNPIYDSREGCNAIIESSSNKLILGCEKTTIPDGVSIIGFSAFINTNISSVKFPNSVISIEEQAFDGCYNLVDIVFSNSINLIGRAAFRGCGMNKIIIPNELSVIGEYAFCNCYHLNTVEFSNSLTTIGEGAFISCTSLENIIIPNSVTTIGERAFDGSGLTTIIVPGSITEIAGKTFEYCSKLTTVYLQDNVNSIGGSAFEGCKKLETVVIPSSLKYIDQYAFRDCKNLKNFYSYPEVPIDYMYYVFEGIDIKNATLHVPGNSIDTYNSSYPWKNFGTIVPLNNDDPNPTGILSTTLQQNTKLLYYFTIEGKHIEKPNKGIYVVRMSDGSIKKVIIK